MQNSNLYAGQCGGADKWADVTSAINIFCPADIFAGWDPQIKINVLILQLAKVKIFKARTYKVLED